MYLHPYIPNMSRNNFKEIPQEWLCSMVLNANNSLFNLVTLISAVPPHIPDLALCCSCY